MIAALLRRRRAPDLHARRLALGVFGADAWPHRGARPTTIIAKALHFLAGAALGLVVGLVLIWLAVGCP